jgi:hypothetical protein
MWGIHRRTFASCLVRMAWIGGQTSWGGMTTIAVVNTSLPILVHLLAVLIPILSGSPFPMLHVVQHPQGSLQSGLAELLLDLVGDFIQAGLSLMFGFGEQTQLHHRRMLEAAHPDP